MKDSKHLKGKNTPRGGVIPYYTDENETLKMLFMVPSNSKYGGKRFQIAKGKIDKEDESIEAGAFREAKEELGLFEPNIEEKFNLGQFGKIHVFVARIKDPDLFGEPHFETGNTKWMTPEEFQKEGREWQRPIVKAATRLIYRKSQK